MKFSSKDFCTKCAQIQRNLRIWWRLRKKSLMKNFIFCAVKIECNHVKFTEKMLSEDGKEAAVQRYS